MKKTLKLILLAILLFAVMLVFTACGSSEEETSDEEVENSSSSTVSENEEEAIDEEESSNTSSSGNRVLDDALETMDETTILSVTESVKMGVSVIVADYIDDLYVTGTTSGTLDEYIEENLEDELNIRESEYTVNFTGSITTDSTENCEVEYQGETYLFSITLSEAGNSAEAEYVE